MLKFQCKKKTNRLAFIRRWAEFLPMLNFEENKKKTNFLILVTITEKKKINILTISYGQ